ncbi:uncharacterized protein SOCE836_101080 [Sorangium cellulosum]|uniref:Reverse transcriptase domain-containing protein n=1 Tax=Sorangium cellulosum TaxID=56 RepID=A0A4V0NHU3_SORCE|nr:uncharacterized protein SOCE836_101080 [Sorangium cellulosum]
MPSSCSWNVSSNSSCRCSLRKPNRALTRVSRFISDCSCRDSSTGGDHRSIREPPAADEIMARRDGRAFHRSAGDCHKINLIGALATLIVRHCIDGRPVKVACKANRTGIVQAAVREVLEVVYEPVFRDVSYGFRPGRSAHGALPGDDPLVAPAPRSSTGVMATRVPADERGCIERPFGERPGGVLLRARRGQRQRLGRRLQRVSRGPLPASTVRTARWPFTLAGPITATSGIPRDRAPRRDRARARIARRSSARRPAASRSGHRGKSDPCSPAS